MYRLVANVDPDAIEAIAAQLFVEMLEAGYTSVGEFHYLHHDREGRSYACLAETSERIVAAAEHTGHRAHPAASALHLVRIRGRATFP